MYQNTDKELKNEVFLNSNTKKGLGIIEFLLSILVIAILSALMIPMLATKMPANKDTQKPAPSYDIETCKQLYRSAYSDASQIWSQLYNEGTLKSRSGWVSDQSNYDNFTQFMSKFNILKQCTYPNNSDCWPPNETSNVVSGHPYSEGDRCFIDTAARSWCEAYSWGWFIVDVNGLKRPNQFGIDRFIFYTISGSDINASGTPDKLIFDNDYNSFDANKCPNPPCYYRSWIAGGN